MQFQTLKRAGLASALTFTLATTGCANMSDTDRRVGTGIGIGAVTGALVTGGDIGGAAVGSVLGGVGGWLYDREKKKRYYYDSRGRRVYER
ncbi:MULTISPECIES: glycine zipper domain-containing protein [Microbulbifer]|uniref:Glycine zipper domain-containing protein n=1 Tax=Microbulbifer celer TaxID=435905 RepID=A0ABW3U3D2_9GAMM|nr:MULTISPECIES: glycine zipper domain-containing protein [Microbulbifer]UFN58097.1 glycine zipper domain-containing protein [Microbulbifer celer]